MSRIDPRPVPQPPPARVLPTTATQPTASSDDDISELVSSDAIRRPRQTRDEVIEVLPIRAALLADMIRIMAAEGGWSDAGRARLLPLLRVLEGIANGRYDPKLACMLAELVFQDLIEAIVEHSTELDFLRELLAVLKLAATVDAPLTGWGGAPSGPATST